MPEVAAVMTATLPSSFPIAILLNDVCFCQIDGTALEKIH
jgi:hypothetical protein